MIAPRAWLAIAGVAICAALLAWALRLDHLRADARRDAAAQMTAHVQTIRTYRAAQAAAAEAEAQRVSRVAADQQRISSDVSTDLSRDLAALRARYERLRTQAAAGAGRAADSVAVSGLPAAAGGTAAPADGDGFSLERRLTASEQALQLDALISWAERQAGVAVE